MEGTQKITLSELARRPPLQDESMEGLEVLVTKECRGIDE